MKTGLRPGFLFYGVLVARTYLDNAAAGRPASEGFTAARAEFIRDFLGLPGHLAPETGCLAALAGASRPFLATLSLDRMHSVETLRNAVKELKQVESENGG